MCLQLVATNFVPPQKRPRRMQLCFPPVCNLHPLVHVSCATHLICSACFVLNGLCPLRFDTANCGSACTHSALEPFRQGPRFADGTDGTWCPPRSRTPL